MSGDKILIGKVRRQTTRCCTTVDMTTPGGGMGFMDITDEEKFEAGGLRAAVDARLAQMFPSDLLPAIWPRARPKRPDPFPTRIGRIEKLSRY